MPQINLTTLSGQELRQRLDASRARGNASLAYEILREMATRRAAESGRRPLLKRRAAEPRIVDVDLGDPLEKDDDLPAMPHWRAPEPPATEAEARFEAPDPQRPGSDAAESEVAPERPPKPLRRRTATTEQAFHATAPAAPDDLPRFRVLDAPLTLRDPAADSAADAEPAGLRLDAPPPHRTADSRPSGHILRVAAGFAVGIATGAALGWFAADLNRDAPAATVAPVAMARDAARPPPAAVLEVVAEPAASPVEVATAPSGAVTDVVPRAEPEPAPAPEEAAATAEPEPTAVAAEDACGRESTPADRAICADPELQRLQVDLRRAYADALDAHEDRALLRERQLAWREARNEVVDPARLAHIYELRIRKLQAAAAEARAMR